MLLDFNLILRKNEQDLKRNKLGEIEANLWHHFTEILFENPSKIPSIPDLQPSKLAHQPHNRGLNLSVQQTRSYRARPAFLQITKPNSLAFHPFPFSPQENQK